MEPWNLREEDQREADTKPTFIIFCEDQVSEPVYLKYFETSSIKVNTIQNQKSKMDNVLKAITHCNQHNLFQKGEVQDLLTDSPYVWCVFDRDKNEDKMDFENTSFDESISLANEKGIKVAWSNDSFELWILLHFEEIDPMEPDNKVRDTYYTRLTELLKGYPSKNDYHQRTTTHGIFSYKKDFKQEKKFKKILLEIITPHICKAIERAQALEDHYKTQNRPFHQQAPRTTVHHLVQELLKLGGKDVIH